MSTTSDKPVHAAGRTRLTGFVPPIVTPFRDGELDLDSLKRTLDDLAGHVSGVLVGGSVGEAASLTVDERIRVMQAVSTHLNGSCSLAVSIADNVLENSRRLSDAAGEVAADLLVVSCPNYFTNDGRMLEAYFAKVSEFASADLCLYDNPIASGTPLSVSTIKALAASTPRLTHVKLTDPLLDKMEELSSDTELVIHSGDDIVLWHQLTRGSEGAMVALPMIYPERASAIWRAFEGDDLEAAWEEYRQVTSFIHVALGAQDFVQVIKAVLHHRGLIGSPEVRLPLVPLSTPRTREVLASL